MKRYLVIALFLCCALPAEAQFFGKERVINNPNFDQQRYSWGYFLGFNTYDFDFDYESLQKKDLIVDKTIGFNVGLVGNMRLNNNFDLRLEPGVAFNRINFTFPGLENNFREINSTYVHIPLLLKFSTDRLNNFKPFVVGGISTSLNLSSNENNPDDNYDGQFRMTTHSYNYEIGFGIDLYLYYFKFTPSIRGVFSFHDDLVKDDNPQSVYTGNIDNMSTRAVFLNFTFQ